jgi:hypothetical protein
MDCGSDHLDAVMYRINAAIYDSSEIRTHDSNIDRAKVFRILDRMAIVMAVSKTFITSKLPWRPIGLRDVKDPTLSRQ